MNQLQPKCGTDRFEGARNVEKVRNRGFGQCYSPFEDQAIRRPDSRAGRDEDRRRFGYFRYRGYRPVLCAGQAA